MKIGDEVEILENIEHKHALKTGTNGIIVEMNYYPENPLWIGVAGVNWGGRELIQDLGENEYKLIK